MTTLDGVYVVTRIELPVDTHTLTPGGERNGDYLLHDGSANSGGVRDYLVRADTTGGLVVQLDPANAGPQLTLHRPLPTDEVASEPVIQTKPSRARKAVSSDRVGINVIGVEDVLVRLAKCCTPVPGDQIVGYISMGRGITVHRQDCPNVRALQRNPERFTDVEWEGGASAGFLVQIAVDAWDRARLLEDVARTFAEHGANIVSYGGTVEDGMAKNWYTAEVGEVKELRSLLTALRNLDAVFDAYRVTPS